MISICIIEDILEIQSGLKQIIDQSLKFEVIKCFDNAEDAIIEIPTLQPQIVLADINLPRLTGVACMVAVKSKFPNILFMMFTIHEDNDMVFEALKAGASGYILKNTAPEKIIEALTDLYEGGSPMSPKIARKVLDSLSKKSSRKIDFEIITKREVEVLELLGKGFLYKEIGDKLCIATSTVKRHLNNIYTKFQVQNKTEALNKFYGRD